MRRLAALVFATALVMAMSDVCAVADDDVVLAGTVRDGGEPVSTQVRVYRLRTALEALWTIGPSSANPTEFPELWSSGVFELFHPADRSRHEVTVTESDASGMFKVEGLAPGHYECEAQTPDGGVAVSSALQRDAGLHAVELDLANDAWPIVSGQVLEHDGSPFRGLVHAWHAGMVPGALGLSVPTDAKGSFAVRVPIHDANGAVGLAAIEPGRRVIRWALPPDRDAGVTYVGGGHGRLSVVVRAAGTGAPISGAHVLRATRLTLSGEREREVFEMATTDAAGHAWMGRPPPTGTTSYTVIQAPGFQRTVDGVEATGDRVDFTLASSVPLAGRLEGLVPSDSSEWFATLWLWPSHWYFPIWRTAPLRHDGTFDLGDVPGAPCRAIVGVRGPGFVGVRWLDARWDAMVRLPAWLVPPTPGWQEDWDESGWPRCPDEDRQLRRDIEVPIEPTTRLRVAVHDASGAPLRGARLWLSRTTRRDERPLAAAAWWFSRRALSDSRERPTTDLEGTAEFGELVVGEFVSISVEREDHRLVELGHTMIRSRGIQTLELTLPDAKD